MVVCRIRRIIIQCDLMTMFIVEVEMEGGYDEMGYEPYKGKWRDVCPILGDGIGW